MNINNNINETEFFSLEELEQIRLEAEREAQAEIERLKAELNTQAWAEMFENLSHDDNEYYEDDDDAGYDISDIFLFFN